MNAALRIFIGMAFATMVSSTPSVVRADPTPAAKEPTKVALAVNGQLTLNDVRVSAFNVRETEVIDANGQKVRALTAAVRVYFRDDASKDMAMRASVGTRFEASGHQYEVLAVERKRVVFAIR